MLKCLRTLLSHARVWCWSIHHRQVLLIVCYKVVLCRPPILTKTTKRLSERGNRHIQLLARNWSNFTRYVILQYWTDITITYRGELYIFLFLFHFTEKLRKSKMSWVQVSPGTNLTRNSDLIIVQRHCKIGNLAPIEWLSRFNWYGVTSNLKLCRRKMIISELLNLAKIISWETCSVLSITRT